MVRVELDIAHLFVVSRPLAVDPFFINLRKLQRPILFARTLRNSLFEDGLLLFFALASKALLDLADQLLAHFHADFDGNRDQSTKNSFCSICRTQASFLWLLFLLERSDLSNTFGCLFGDFLL